ncbi:hypothetical protein ILYODFUR_037799 [Ilyodon furcidens]|uniref:Uncharacterized protein n=1 Tax=Ilyodon furcidens TaxID=33524 RepID=A0ABV0UYI5_9TELE
MFSTRCRTLLFIRISTNITTATSGSGPSDPSQQHRVLYVMQQSKEQNTNRTIRVLPMSCFLGLSTFACFAASMCNPLFFRSLQSKPDRIFTFTICFFCGSGEGLHLGLLKDVVKGSAGISGVSFGAPGYGPPQEEEQSPVGPSTGRTPPELFRLQSQGENLSLRFWF